jgi:hypothetical protein
MKRKNIYQYDGTVGFNTYRLRMFNHNWRK